jgi:hypothetical protein
MGDRYDYNCVRRFPRQPGELCEGLVEDEVWNDVPDRKYEMGTKVMGIRELQILLQDLFQQRDSIPYEHDNLDWDDIRWEIDRLIQRTSLDIRRLICISGEADRGIHEAVETSPRG